MRGGGYCFGENSTSCFHPLLLHPLLWAEVSVISKPVVCIDTPSFRNPPSPLTDKVLPELPASFSMTTKPPFPSNPGCSLPRPPLSTVGSPVVSFLCPLGSSLPLSPSLGSLSTCREQTSQFGWLLPFSLSALCLLFAPLLWQLSAFFCLSSSNTFLSLPPQAPVPTPASA